MDVLPVVDAEPDRRAVRGIHLEGCGIEREAVLVGAGPESEAVVEALVEDPERRNRAAGVLVVAQTACGEP